MRWKSHRIISAVAAYTMGLPVEGIIAVTAGSILPDLIEFLLRAKHRDISHFWGIYLALFLFFVYWPFSNDFLFSACLSKWLVLGCLFHIIEDAASKDGVPFFPGLNKKIKIGELYYTGTRSEFVTVICSVSFLLLLKTLLVLTENKSWLPSFLLAKKFLAAIFGSS